MKLLLLLLIVPVLPLLPYSSFSQEYSYTHYDVKDGLAGSNVYCITQDKEGFLWMGTDAGLSRFDGTHFKNFSLEDGLPDIEVLLLFTDSKGRVWMRPFSKAVCFYYKGRIHNQDNDTLLKRIHIRKEIENFAEDRDGNILLQERAILHFITPQGQVEDIENIGGRGLVNPVIGTGPDGHFLIVQRDTLYRLAQGRFSFADTIDAPDIYSKTACIQPGIMIWQHTQFGCKFKSLRTGKTVAMPLGETAKNIIFSPVGDSLVYKNESMGASEYNIFTGTVRHFRTGVAISRTYRDDEGNIWFASLGQGVFRLNSEEIRNISLISMDSAFCTALTISGDSKELLIGANAGMLFRLAIPSFKDAGSQNIMLSNVDDVRFVKKMEDGHLIVGTTSCMFDWPRKKPSIMFSVKTAVMKNDAELLVGGYAGVRLFDTKNYRIKDTLWTERTTAVFYSDHLTYVGTLNGLYVVKPDKSFEYWGGHDPLLQKRISSIVQSGDSTLWIATYGGGIVAWKNGRRQTVLSRKQGLSSDLCRVLYLRDNLLWVGTDKGLNKVDIGDPDHPVTSYTAGDGLGSDIINAIYTDSAMVYVGTPAGLSFFNVAQTGNTSGCRLNLLGVINSDKDRKSDTSSLRLSYTGNNIRFEYVGISYRSAGNMSYAYRLLGLDSNWKRTKETFLDYPTLPSGDYELQLQAINKFGVRSLPMSVRFTVATPFWKTVWFDAAVLVCFVFLTWLFVTWRIRGIRRRQAEKEELHKRMAETEHMALQAQMNPHFIFNCLNSIQQYIFDQDIQVANKYLTGFAKLIRATLHNSSKPFISLTEEIAYISAYLSLEKLRFKEKMDYSIDVALSLRGDLDDIHIPPMLIQPYVENSMRHGLRHRTEGGGYIRISIQQEGDKLVFIIEDNGIGREEAARYKTREHIEYQSKGMSLTADRIRLINTANGDDIEVEIIDLKDLHGQGAGTRVIIRFPRYDLLLQKNTI
ncbi:MAG: histidine kinase [Chitinophagaceae bacterium]|nr:histidine kinase [Chitinophagaceae bacterium]